MATDESFVVYIQTQSGLRSELSFRKMFGEYSLYLHGKVVAFACDNQLYVKPTEAGSNLLGTVAQHSPFPGAKLYFRIDDEMEDRDLLARLFRTTADALPMPKVKAPANAKARQTPARSPARKAGTGPKPR